MSLQDVHAFFMLILLVIVDSDHNHMVTTLALHNCPTRILNKTYIYVGHVIEFVGDFRLGNML